MICKEHERGLLNEKNNEIKPKNGKPHKKNKQKIFLNLCNKKSNIKSKPDKKNLYFFVVESGLDHFFFARFFPSPIFETIIPNKSQPCESFVSADRFNFEAYSLCSERPPQQNRNNKRTSSATNWNRSASRVIKILLMSDFNVNICECMKPKWIQRSSNLLKNEIS